MGASAPFATIQRMPTLLSFLVRLLLVVVGVLFAASLAVAFVLMLGWWGARAAWARLTGGPVMPFVVRIDPRGGFARFSRRAEQGSRTPRADSVQRGRKIGDVSDVEARTPR
jgi:hypothetical protein